MADNYGDRPDGTAKGLGYFGALKRPDGRESTELSVGINLDGKEILIPLLVPTLDKSEINHLLSGKDYTESILEKAVSFATERMRAGRPPFADAGDGPANMDPAFMGRMQEKMRGGPPRAAPPKSSGGAGALSQILSFLSPGSMAPRTGGMPDSAMPNRNVTTDNGMAMSMGDPRKAVPPTKIPNAYRGPMVGRGALSDLPYPGYPEQWNRGI